MRRRFTSNRETSSVGYCAITATQDNTNIRCAEFTYIYYAINDISNWSCGSTLIIATLNTGDTVYLKSSGDVSFHISGDKDVELSGSILSLVYGDNNSNETSLSHITQAIASFSNIVSVSSDFLPSKDLGKSCYESMFFGCTSLVNAPELPATTLATYCYRNMFYGCTELTTAPELPATTLTDGCYQSMFNGCTNLNYIKMLATDISAKNCLYYWVDGVASSGIFVKNPDATWEVYGNRGIPNGWTVKMDGEEDNGLISFTIDGEEYNALPNMTWGVWVDSEYDMEKFGIELDNSIFYMVGLGGYVGTEEDYVYVSDIIQEGYEYWLIS